MPSRFHVISFHRALLLGALLAALPCLAWAQPRVDSPTGITPARHSLEPDRVEEYLKAMEEVTTTISWTTAGDSTETFGPNVGSYRRVPIRPGSRRMKRERRPMPVQIRMTATWRKPRGGGAPVMTSATIEPVNREYFRLGDHKIYKLIMKSNGEIEVQRHGIDTTIYKITKKSNGDLVLDLPWYHGGDETIKAADIGPVDLSRWPPRIDEVYRSLVNRPTSGPSATQHEGTLTWDVSGRAGQYTFPIEGGALSSEGTTFDVKGTGRLNPDGTFTTIGDKNTATVTVNVGGRYARDNGAFAVTTVNKRDGKPDATFNGKYSIDIPAGEQPFEIGVDGRLSYDVQGRDMVVNLPSGARIDAKTVNLEGAGKLKGTIRETDGSLVLSDGTYELAVDGPIRIRGYEDENFTIDDLVFEDGQLSGRGTIDEVSTNRIATNGNWHGRLQTARGAIGVLMGEGASAKTELGEDTDLRVDLTNADVEIGMPDGDRSNTDFSLSADGRIDGTLDMRNVEVDGSKVKVTADRATTTVDDFTLTVDTETGMTNGRGNVNARITEGGVLDYKNMTGYPVLPFDQAPVASTQRTHKVVPGDTLGALARTYGTTVNEIRDANGIPRDSSLIRVGQVLQIPGEEAQAGSHRLHRVKADETIWDIARQYEVPVPMIREANSIPEDAMVKAGETLRIPGSGPLPEGDPTQRGHWRGPLQEGELNLEIANASIGPDGVKVDGHVSATVVVNTSDLVAGRLRAKILGSAQATLARTRFNVRPGPDGTYSLKVDEVRIPVRLVLEPGSVMTLDSPGREMKIEITGNPYDKLVLESGVELRGRILEESLRFYRFRDLAGAESLVPTPTVVRVEKKHNSYANFTVVTHTDENGRLVIDELQEVDLFLHSDGDVSFAGEVAHLQGGKSLSFRGTMRFLRNGIDMDGPTLVGADGLKIRW